MDVGSSKFIYRFSPYVALVLGQMGGSRSVMLVHGKKGLVYSLSTSALRASKKNILSQKKEPSTPDGSFGLCQFLSARAVFLGVVAVADRADPRYH